MIYKSAPAWSLHPKTHHHQQPPTPSPVAYNPTPSSTLSKSPSWKIGKQLRSIQKKQRSPSPASYTPAQPEKNNKMGVIGKDSKSKQNVNPYPGPGSYEVRAKKDSKYISFSKKYGIANKNAQFPSPFNYNIPSRKDKRGASIGRQERFTVQEKKLAQHPGPGNYQISSTTSSSIKFTKAPRMSHQTLNSNCMLGPGHYEIKSEFEKNMQKAKGYKMAEKHISSSPHKTPGPTDYSPTHKDLPTSPSISFSRKYKEREPERSPSPNQYDPLFEKTIHKSQSYSIGKAERLPLNGSNNMPGPGAYLKTQYTTSGAQISLGMSRKIEEREDLPGPGAYNPNKEAILKRPATAKLGKSQRFYKIKTQTSNTSFYESKVQFHSPKYSFSKQKKLDEKYHEGPGPGSYLTPSSLCNLPSYALKH